MEPTKLIFIRHGETEWNAQERWQGFQNSPLTANGKQQTQALGKRMGKVTFDHLYSSDLGRAYETAQPIAEATGHSIVTETFLREKNLGIFEGLTRSELLERFPETYQHFQKCEPGFVIPNGESIDQFFERCVAGFEVLVNRHPQETLVVVAHGGVLANLFRFIFDLPFEVPSPFEVKNTSINTVSFREGRWKMHTWGDTAHLDTMVLNMD